MSLDSISPLDGRYRERLASIREGFGEPALMKARLEVEIRWLIALSDHPDIAELPALSPAARDWLRAELDAFGNEAARAVKRLEGQTRHDVKAIELYLRERLESEAAPEGLAAAVPFLHIGCTSEDINNVAYALLIGRATEHTLTPAIASLLDQLRSMAKAHRAVAMPARTHGQLASPSTWGKEMAVYAERLAKSLSHWRAITVEAKFNGAVGNYNAHSFVWPKLDWPRFCRSFIEGLGLRFNACTTQIEPGDWLVRWLNELALLDSIALDFARDMWGYVAIAYLRAKPLAADEVGSSTMPHKINPIDFENAEGNLAVAIGLAQTLARDIPLSRWQRDLSGSTRMRNLGVVAGHSLLALRSLLEGLRRIDIDPARMGADLEEGHELLTEALQSELRRLGHADAYERVKALSRGQRLDAARWRALLDGLDLPAPSRDRLAALSPSGYTGLAANIVERLGRKWEGESLSPRAADASAETE